MPLWQMIVCYGTLAIWVALGFAGSVYWLLYTWKMKLGWAWIVDVFLAVILTFFGGLAWFLIAYWEWKDDRDFWAGRFR